MLLRRTGCSEPSGKDYWVHLVRGSSSAVDKREEVRGRRLGKVLLFIKGEGEVGLFTKLQSQTDPKFNS